MRECVLLIACFSIALKKGAVVMIEDYYTSPDVPLTDQETGTSHSSLYLISLIVHFPSTIQESKHTNIHVGDYIIHPVNDAARKSSIASCRPTC